MGSVRREFRLTDEQSRKVDENRGLVIHLLNKPMGRGYVRQLGEDECVSLGMLGLCNAADDYQPEKGEFSTHAGWCIFGQWSHAARRENRRKRIAELRPISQLADELPSKEHLSDDVARRDFIDTHYARVARVLSELPERSREIVERYYGLNGHKSAAMSAVASAVGISRSRANQINASALQKIRNALAGVSCTA